MVAATVSTAAFSSVCSASWIAETDDREAAAAADREVADGLLDALGGGTLERRVGRRRRSRASSRGRPRLAKAAGTTTSDTNGAAAMPRAIADWPCVMPTAAASAKAIREADSMKTSPP